MEETVWIHHVSLTFGEAAARLMLHHVLSSFGLVISIELSGSTAVAMFSTSSAAQKAYLELNGFPLFDSELSVTIGERALAPGLTSASLSPSPSALILCNGADATWVSVLLKRVRGVELVQPISARQCVVRLSDEVAGCRAYDIMRGITHPSGRTLSVCFLRAVV